MDYILSQMNPLHIFQSTFNDPLYYSLIYTQVPYLTFKFRCMSQIRIQFETSITLPSHLRLGPPAAS